MRLKRVSDCIVSYSDTLTIYTMKNKKSACPRPCSAAQWTYLGGPFREAWIWNNTCFRNHAGDTERQHQQERPWTLSSGQNPPRPYGEPQRQRWLCIQPGYISVELDSSFIVFINFRQSVPEQRGTEYGSGFFCLL